MLHQEGQSGRERDEYERQADRAISGSDGARPVADRGCGRGGYSSKEFDIGCYFG